MQKMYCYVDESGTLPDKNDRVIIMAAVATNLPQTLIDVSRQVRKEIQSRKKTENISEIKFYDLISNRIITETIVRWQEAKRRFIEKRRIKNST